jgi:uncharacterized protein with PQ loop repeat
MASEQPGVGDESVTEVITMISIDSVCYVLIIITLVFQTIKHVRHKKVERVQSRSTIVIFVCLGFSYLAFFMYGALKHAITIARISMSSDPGGEQRFDDWNARTADI